MPLINNICDKIHASHLVLMNDFWKWIGYSQDTNEQKLPFKSFSKQKKYSEKICYFKCWRKLLLPAKLLDNCCLLIHYSICNDAWYSSEIRWAEKSSDGVSGYATGAEKPGWLLFDKQSNNAATGRDAVLKMSKSLMSVAELFQLFAANFCGFPHGSNFVWFLHSCCFSIDTGLPISVLFAEEK